MKSTNDAVGKNKKGSVTPGQCLGDSDLSHSLRPDHFVDDNTGIGSQADAMK